MKFLSVFFFFKQKTAYEIGWCDWSSEVCSSDLHQGDGLPALRADRDQPILHIAALHLVREGGDEAYARGAERMADRARPSHDVDDVLVDLPSFCGESLEIRQYLGRECLVHLDQTQVLPLDACSLQCPRHSPNRRLEQLPTRIHRRDGVRPHIGERGVTKRTRGVVAHQQYRRGA